MAPLLDAQESIGETKSRHDQHSFRYLSPCYLGFRSRLQAYSSLEHLQGRPAQYAQTMLIHCSENTRQRVTTLTCMISAVMFSSNFLPEYPLENSLRRYIPHPKLIQQQAMQKKTHLCTRRSYKTLLSVRNTRTKSNHLSGNKSTL
jgi:hypothetical protein